MSLSQRNYDEKRSFIRMKVNTAIELEVTGTNEPTIKGICRNLSGGGMLVELPKMLPLGAALKVELNSTHGHAPMLKAQTRVTRIAGGAKGADENCYLGLEIVEMID